MTIQPGSHPSGAFAHFLQTVIHSKQRRETSILLGSFLKLIANWRDSHWLLEPKGLHNALTLLTTDFRNRAAHIDELGKQDYVSCRELVMGPEGVLWKLCGCYRTPQPVDIDIAIQCFGFSEFGMTAFLLFFDTRLANPPLSSACSLFSQNRFARLLRMGTASMLRLRPTWPRPRDRDLTSLSLKNVELICHR